MSAGSAASGDLPVYPGERPSVADAKAWRLGSLDMMPTDWKALIAGIPPHSLVHLIALPVPAVLTVDETGPPIVSYAMKSTRDLVIAETHQKNLVMDATRVSGMAALQNGIFDALKRSLRPNAPLLLASLETAHPLAGAYAAWHNGPAAFADIVARSAPATALAPETDEHEDHMTAMRLKPLPDGCSSDDFSKRVNDALVNHIPFLRRPFPVADGSLGTWIVQQMPEALAADGRRLVSTLSIAQLSNGSAVASSCIAIVASGQKPSIKDGPLGDFILVQEDGAAADGRRPRGLDDRRGGGGKGKGAGGGKGGKGKAASGGKGQDRAIGCSTPAPRGPTCKFNHPPPCYRDADWPGPIPQYVIDNKARFTNLLADRDAVAERLFKAGLRPAGSKAVPLKGPSGRDEVIGVIDLTRHTTRSSMNAMTAMTRWSGRHRS